MKRVAPLLGLICACSFTTATGFNECNTDEECGADRVCLQRYCIRLPPACQRGTGTYSDAHRVAFAALLPLTDSPDGGAIDESEVANLNALELAIDEGNQRDGIKGRPFALFVCNTGDDDATLKAQATFMANTLEVPAVVVSGSAAVISAADVLTPHGSMVISADATSPELIGTYQSSQHLVWRTAPPDTLQAQVVAEQLTLMQQTQPSLAKIGIAYVDTTYGQGLADALQMRLPASFTPKLTPYPRDGDPSGALTTLAAFSPNLTVLVAFPPDVISIVSGAKAHPTLTRLGGNQWFFTDAAKDPAILTPSILSEIDQSYGTAPAQGAGTEFSAFRDRFEAKYMMDPENYGFTSHSYDAMYLLMLGAAYAARDGGDVTGTRMADGFTRLSGGTTEIILSPDNFSLGVSALQMGGTIDVKGSSSDLDLDYDSGCPASSSSPYELWQIRDGGFVTDQIIEPMAN